VETESLELRNVQLAEFDHLKRLARRIEIVTGLVGEEHEERNARVLDPKRFGQRSSEGQIVLRHDGGDSAMVHNSALGSVQRAWPSDAA
jgi:hypothetical protein